MDGIKIKKLNEIVAEVGARFVYYNQDWQGKRKISVREEYILKMRRFINRFKIIKSTIQEGILLEKQLNDSKTFTGEDNAKLAKAQAEKGEIQHEIDKDAFRLQSIENIRQIREKEAAIEKLNQRGFQVPTEAQPIEPNDSTLTQPVEVPENVQPTVETPVIAPEQGISVNGEVDIPTGQPVEVSENAKPVDDVPFTSTDEQINNFMNGLQHVRETVEGGNSITTVPPAEPVETTINQVQEDMAEEVQQIKGINTVEDNMPTTQEKIEETVSSETPVVQPVAGLNSEIPQNNIDTPQEQAKNNEVKISNEATDLINKIGQYAADLSNVITGIQKAALASLAIEQSKNDKLSKQNALQANQIEVMKNEYNSKEIEVQNLTVMNSNKDKQIEDLKASNASKDEEIAKKDAQVIENKNLVAQKDAQIAELNLQVETMQKQFENVRNMISAFQNQTMSVQQPAQEDAKAPYQKS